MGMVFTEDELEALVQARETYRSRGYVFIKNGVICSWSVSHNRMAHTSHLCLVCVHIRNVLTRKTMVSLRANVVVKRSTGG